VCLLKRGERLLIVGPILAIDLARREARAVEQYFLLYERGRAGSGGAFFTGCRLELGAIDGLRIERRGRRRARRGMPCMPGGLRRIRMHQYRSYAEKSPDAGAGGAPADQKRAKHLNDPHVPEG